MDARRRRFCAATLLTIALLALGAGPAWADADPFSQPLGTATTGTGGPASVGGNDPFSPIGSNVTTTAYDPSAGTTGSPPGDGTSTGSTGSPTSGSGSTGSAGTLPFTGLDSETWLVLAYGLLGAGAALLIVAECFGVSRSRRRASPARPGATRSAESSR